MIKIFEDVNGYYRFFFFFIKIDLILGKFEIYGRVKYFIKCKFGLI